MFIGNGLEFYDFLSYGLFAVYIGKAFFPSTDGSLSLLLSLATFGIGFYHPSDRCNRAWNARRPDRPQARDADFVLIDGHRHAGARRSRPPMHSIGIAAPILAVVFRLIQGFALGGEVGPTTAYMVEAAPAGRRGLYGSMQYMTQDAADLLAALVGLLYRAH